MSESKAAYDEDIPFVRSQPLDPDWKPGQGFNSHPKGKAKKEKRIPYKVIEIGKTQIEPRALYKVMLGAIVSGHFYFCFYETR